MIAVVDYGMGNLHSVRLAFEAVGESVTVTSDPADLRRAERIVLPGVGAFGECVKNLRGSALYASLEEEVQKKGKPLLGICLGMQILATEGEELGKHTGLGWVPGRVRRLTAGERGMRVPHIGWNGAARMREHPVFADMKADSTFYYVHSYAFEPSSESHAAATCDYGGAFVCALAKDNIVATQFHPEKSQRDGFAILANFARWKP